MKREDFWVGVLNFAFAEFGSIRAMGHHDDWLRHSDSSKRCSLSFGSADHRCGTIAELHLVFREEQRIQERQQPTHDPCMSSKLMCDTAIAVSDVEYDVWVINRQFLKGESLNINCLIDG